MTHSDWQTPRSGEVKWLGPDEDSTSLWLVLDASSGTASGIDPSTGDVTVGVVLALSGSTLVGKEDQDQRDYVFNFDQAMAVAGMLFSELPPLQRAQLLAHWQTLGLLP